MVPCFGLGPTIEESERVLITATPSNVTSAGPRSRAAKGDIQPSFNEQKAKKSGSQKINIVDLSTVSIGEGRRVRFDRLRTRRQPLQEFDAFGEISACGAT
jgi:hypothetical protein